MLSTDVVVLSLIMGHSESASKKTLASAENNGGRPLAYAAFIVLVKSMQKRFERLQKALCSDSGKEGEEIRRMVVVVEDDPIHIRRIDRLSMFPLLHSLPSRTRPGQIPTRRTNGIIIYTLGALSVNSERRTGGS